MIISPVTKLLIEEAVEENLNVPVEVADEATSLETEEVKESN